MEGVLSEGVLSEGVLFKGVLSGGGFVRAPLKPMKGLFDLGQLKSKCGARHCLFCAGINDQSHFPAANPGFAHRCFRKNGASTMPRVNDLKIAIEIQ